MTVLKPIKKWKVEVIVMDDGLDLEGKPDKYLSNKTIKNYIENHSFNHVSGVTAKVVRMEIMEEQRG